MKKGMTSVVYLLHLVVRALTVEPSCPVCSRYEYEEKLLERVLRNELSMENTHHDIKGTHSKVVDALKKLHDEIDQVNTAIGTMNHKQIAMENTLDNATKRSLTNVSEALSHILKESGRAIKEIEGRVDRIKGEIKTPTILFRALLASSITVSGGQDIVFTRVEVNEGQGYDKGTGKFTASVAGLYNFVVQYSTQSKLWVYLEIVHNGKSLQTSAHYGTGAYQSSSLQVYVLMSMADTVWVRATSTSNHYQPLSDPRYSNTFSGVLIRV